MKCTKETMLLYAVTDRAWVGKQTLYQQIESALLGGVTCVQLREKGIDTENFLKEACEIRELCRKYQVPFIINDNVEVAIGSNADGIHVGQRDMKANEVRKLIGDKMILGVSAQTVEQAIEAERAGADYLGVGAAFTTTTKLDASSVTFDTIQSICKQVSIPVVAIGGINKNNIRNLAGSGVDGVALVSSIFSVEYIEEECKELLTLSKNMVCSQGGRG